MAGMKIDTGKVLQHLKDCELTLPSPSARGIPGHERLGYFETALEGVQAKGDFLGAGFAFEGGGASLYRSSNGSHTLTIPNFEPAIGHFSCSFRYDENGELDRLWATKEKMTDGFKSSIPFRDVPEAYRSVDRADAILAQLSPANRHSETAK